MSKFAESASHETLYQQPSVASAKAKDSDLRNDKPQRSRPFSSSNFQIFLTD
jgi:hypothetical protein